MKKAQTNPSAARAQQLRSAVLDAVSSNDIEAVFKKLIELAKAGNIQAARLLLDRACGKMAVDNSVPEVPADAGPDKKDQARVMLLSIGRASNAG